MFRPYVATGPVHFFLKTVLLCGLVVAAVAVIYKSELTHYLSGTTPLWDFDIYWQTARDVWQGGNPYASSYMQISGPPLVVVPFFSLAWLPLPLARTLFTCLSVFSLVITSWLLAKTIVPKQVMMATLFFFTLLLLPFPTRFNFITGQPNLLVMALVTWYLTTKRSLHRSWLVALQVLVKTNYVVQFFASKNWKELFMTGAMLLIITVFSMAIISPKIYWHFFTERAGGYFFTPLATTDVDYYNQSVRATLARFHAQKQSTVILVSFFLVSMLYLLSVSDPKQTTLFSLLLSPLIWQHYLAVVYPVLLLILWQLWRERRWVLFSWGGVATVLLTGHIPTLHGSVAAYPSNLLASHYLVGIVVLSTIQAVYLFPQMKKK